MSTAALIVAAGRGTRAGGPLPKQWQMLAGKPVIHWTVDAFRSYGAIGRIMVVVHPDDEKFLNRLHGVETALGGASRADSVRNGLVALQDNAPTHVLIHDAARACVSYRVIDGVMKCLQSGARGAAPAIAVTDALWHSAQGQVTGTQDRTGLFRAQTPQGFVFDDILKAHLAHDGSAADDVEVARNAGLDVTITQGDDTNIKITAPGDFARAKAILGAEMDIRIGTGFDVHRFGPGDTVVLCSVAIPHDRALQGHSDADVGLHALTDAIYGALAEGDIGRHFPPSEDRWKGADSAIFLEHAVQLVAEKGYKINNMDITLICERPKITPHAPAMMARLAQITGLDLNRVSVKATTSERLGFTGRGEGIAAQAAVTLAPIGVKS